ncbi:elongation of very long chain fatty acids protein AAEL008004-like [Culex pipiens pallens]|uniref:elongation of very long chain fatty acids protein AAEL008004-like n=1 Tax=Culex pipiens pallens TaxID=42434 RepID=UPI001953249E|nr:elongation of very long chain fatty acids protein AAEL008004-like [Culex pipiens pallens]
MEALLSKITHGYNYFMVESRDSRNSGLPLINSSWQVPAILAIYLLTVLKIGPRFMENRKAYDLKNVIWSYNLFQIVANGALFLAEFYLIGIRTNFNYVCQPVDFSPTKTGYEELYMTYAYFLIKIVELTDTLFFVLRKKQSHVTFLHVYHHSIMLTMSYLAVLFVPGGHIYLLGLWNTLVHVVLYQFYNLQLFQSPWAARFKSLLPKMQLAQFVHLAYHFGRPAILGIDCGFPMVWHWIGFGQAFFILIMSLNIYINSFMQKSKKQA